MPIIEQLNALKQRLTIQTTQLSVHNTTPLHALEARYTLFHLKRLLRNHQHPGFETGLIWLLQERWNRIQCTSAQYCYDIMNPANVMCVALAKALAGPNKPWIYLLMPSLENVANNVYISSSIHDEDICLPHLCLDDQQKRILFIPEILSYSETSGAYYQSSLYASKLKLLSESELHAVRSKHPSITDYMVAIQEKIAFEVQQETLGHRVSRLIKGLNLGSVEQPNNGATEFEEGADADWSIIEFLQYIETLSTEKRKILFEMHIVTEYGELSIERCWNYLIRNTHYEQFNKQLKPKITTHPLDTCYCVSMIARDLESILNEPNNKKCLFNTYSYEQYDNHAYQQLQQRVAETKTIMEACLMSTTQFEFAENPLMQHQLAYQLFKKLATDVDFILTKSDKNLAAEWQRTINKHHKPEFYNLLNRIINRKSKPLNTENNTHALFFKPSKQAKKSHQHSTVSQTGEIERNIEHKLSSNTV